MTRIELQPIICIVEDNVNNKTNAEASANPHSRMEIDNKDICHFLSEIKLRCLHISDQRIIINLLDENQVGSIHLIGQKRQ